ncbi:MAG: hypothetical protein LBE13_10745 [Bacteroidales bacterium]|nr:hypothetical protein [Bacteroidales bacterium]
MKKFYQIKYVVKVPLVIFPSKEELDEYNSNERMRLPWIIGYIDKHQQVAVVDPSSVTILSYQELLRVFVHEVVHYFGHLSNNVKSGIFHEGLACYIAEQGLMRGAYLKPPENIVECMRELILFSDKMSSEEFSQKHGYFLGSNLICFMIDYFGKEKTIQFFSYSLENLIPCKMFDIEPEEFCALWKQYIKLKF